jgi:hypothetical protein
MNQLILALAACALLAPTVTPAQLGLGLGAQAGVALPLGDQESGTALKDVVSRAFPLELRATWRIAPRVAVGLQGGYGVVSDGDPRSAACASTGVDCTAHLWRVAARGEYALGGEQWLPYAAATLGWEWEVLRWELAGDNWEKATRSGVLAGVELGVDRPVKPKFNLGAYVGLWMARYSALSVKGETAGYGYSDSGSVPSPAIHGWAGVGLRGTFNL